MAGDAFDFVVFGVPRTSQTKSKKSRGDWRRKVRDAAVAEWPNGQAPFDGELSARIVYFFPGQTNIDVDGIIKFILDALKGLVYQDDFSVFEVLCRKTSISELTLLENAPLKLVQSLQSDTDQVFVRICEGPNHEELPL